MRCLLEIWVQDNQRPCFSLVVLCQLCWTDALFPLRTRVSRLSSVFSKFNWQWRGFMTINSEIYCVSQEEYGAGTSHKKLASFFFLLDYWTLFWDSLSWTDLQFSSSFPPGQDFSLFTRDDKALTWESWRDTVAAGIGGRSWSLPPTPDPSHPSPTFFPVISFLLVRMPSESRRPAA